MGGCDDPSDPLATAFLPGLMVCQSCSIRLSAARALSFAVAAMERVSVSCLRLLSAARLHSGWSSPRLVLGNQVFAEYSALCAYYKDWYPPRDCKNRSISRGGRGGGSGCRTLPCGASALHFGGGSTLPSGPWRAPFRVRGGASPYTLQSPNTKTKQSSRSSEGNIPLLIAGRHQG